MKTAFKLLIICVFSYSSFAQPGMLDSSFGKDGIFFSNDSAEYTAAAMQLSGKIVLCGGKNSKKDFKFMLSRRNIDGSVDSSFGKNGFSVSNYGIFFNTEFNALTILNNDKIIATGFALSSEDPTNIVIAKFNANGSPDLTFGNGGYVKYYFNYFEYPNSIAVQTDGKFIIAGAHTPDIYEDTGFVARFLPNGNLDSTFGINGQIRLPEATWLSSIVIQKNQKIVIGGNGLFNSEFFVARLEADGSYDKSFGNGGFIYTRFTKHLHDYVSSITLQADEKIVAAGTVNVNNLGTKSNFGVARYKTNGSIDSSFGEQGLSIIKFGYLSSLRNIFLQKNGSFVLTGGTFAPFDGYDTIAIAKLRNNGTPDISFGANGKVTTTLIINGDNFASALQKDEKIIIAGGFDSNYIARYENLTQKQIIINKIKQYIATHNNAQATSLSNVSIYPNPAQNVLHVAGLSSNKTRLTVIDFMGNAKLQAVANASSYNLNIASLTSGNYLLKIEMNNVVVTKKFVKE